MQTRAHHIRWSQVPTTLNSRLPWSYLQSKTGLNTMSTRSIESSKSCYLVKSWQPNTSTSLWFRPQFSVKLLSLLKQMAMFLTTTSLSRRLAVSSLPKALSMTMERGSLIKELSNWIKAVSHIQTSLMLTFVTQAWSLHGKLESSIPVGFFPLKRFSWDFVPCQT